MFSLPLLIPPRILPKSTLSLYFSLLQPSPHIHIHIHIHHLTPTCTSPQCRAKSNQFSLSSSFHVSSPDRKPHLYMQQGLFAGIAALKMFQKQLNRTSIFLACVCTRRGFCFLDLLQLEPATVDLLIRHRRKSTEVQMWHSTCLSCVYIFFFGPDGACRAAPIHSTVGVVMVTCRRLKKKEC